MGGGTMTTVVPAVFEGGVFRPLEPVSLGDREHVYMLVLPEDPTKVAAAQHAALESLIGISESQETEVSTRHDEFLYPSPR